MPLLGFILTCPVLGGLYLNAMSTAVAQILGEVEKLSATEQRELRRALTERVPISTDSFAPMAEADVQLVAGTWDKLGPSPEVDYEAL